MSKGKLKKCEYCKQMVPELNNVYLCPECQKLYENGEIEMIVKSKKHEHKTAGKAIMWLSVLATPVKIIGGIIGANSAGGTYNYGLYNFIIDILVAAFFFFIGFLLWYFPRNNKK